MLPSTKIVISKESNKTKYERKYLIDKKGIADYVIFIMCGIILILMLKGFL